ncbi:ABC transporter substrate-binding protein [Marinomonas fungiae]|uniref:ABC-type transport system, periplasmic component n=1 Tax=Marinomonas fungiae TaxID=1137284 RepID=A0A0K6IIC3_9GAMM|nr:ABC transporter substrate-binding protein [Marinomonas fungiae]CUB02860.1 ABC-type transport system, periplasmic component [Marinomonas fungiae]
MLRRLLLLWWIGCLASVCYGADLRIAVDADPISLDPHEQLSEAGIQYSHAVFDPLVRWRQDGTFEPRLASSWERLDQRTLRLHLRDDVTFHSGNRMDADDVLFTMDRLKLSTDFKGLFNVVQNVDKIDDYTVDIHTTDLYPLLLNSLAYVFVIDKAFYQGRAEIIKFGQTFAAKNVSGSGPFQVKQRIAGQKLVLERNPHYWDKSSRGNLKQLELITIRSDSTRLAALLTGDVDVISPVAPIDIARVQSTPDINFLALTGTRIVMLQLNQARRVEFQDIRVRKAMNLAINQALIVEKILRGYGEAAGQLSADAFAGHLSTLLPESDLAKAKQLMAEAGYEQGFRISMMAPNNRYMSDERVAQAAAAMLEKINIRVDLKTFPKAQYFQLFDQRAADVMMLGWQSDTFDSNNIFEFILACRDQQSGLGAYNSGGFCDALIDQGITLANNEMKPEQRERILQGIEAHVAAQALVIPLYWQPIIWAAKAHVNLASVVNFLNFPYWGDLEVRE